MQFYYRTIFLRLSDIKGLMLCLNRHISYNLKIRLIVSLIDYQDKYFKSYSGGEPRREL